ncbi:MAG: hypothetical protein ABIF77_13355 [bacterium]
MVYWVLERESEPGLAVDEGCAANVGDALFAARDARQAWGDTNPGAGPRVRWSIKLNDGRRTLAVLGA